MANSKDEGVKDFALGLGNMLMISAFDVDAVKDIFYDLSINATRLMLSIIVAFCSFALIVSTPFKK